MVLSDQEKQGAAFARQMREAEAKRKRDLFTAMSLFVVSFLIVFASVMIVLSKKASTERANKKTAEKVKEVIRVFNKIETDFVITHNYFQECGMDIVFEKTEQGFVIHSIEHKSQIMPLNQKVPVLHDRAVAVQLGYNIKDGDDLILCNADDFFETFKVKTLYKKGPQDNYYIISEDSIGSLVEGKRGVIATKMHPIEYVFEEVDGGSYELVRFDGDDEKKLLGNIVSYDINDFATLDGKDGLEVSFVIAQNQAGAKQNVLMKRFIPYQDGILQ